MLDEPHGYVDEMFPDRESWAARNGFIVHRLTYQGTYRTDGSIVCDLVYLAGDEQFAQKIINRIERLDSLPKIEDLLETYVDV